MIEKYFTHLSSRQKEQINRMESLYREWNSRINVVSRKDIDHLAVHHILHSLTIAKVISFRPGTTVLDAGTGGGFPGIPLAVFFPDVHFTLADSIGKKIKVVEAVAGDLGLTNVSPVNARLESVTGSFDFVTGRAVSSLSVFVPLVSKRVSPGGFNDLANGILYLTGGDVERDLRQIRAQTLTWDISRFFGEEYFKTKKLVHISGFSLFSKPIS